MQFIALKFFAAVADSGNFIAAALPIFTLTRGAPPAGRSWV
jgi:hypothetical protein